MQGNVQKQGMPVWAAVLIIIFIIIVIVSVATADDEDNSKESNSTTTVKKEKLELEDGHYGYSDEYGISYYIEGYVKNNTDKNYNYVQISFTTYDSEGNTIGSCLDNNSSLDANGRWKFKAICSGDAKSTASYKLDKLTGY